MVKGGLDRNNGFLRFTVNDFADAYKKYGQDVNTPAIISNAVSTKLSGLLLCERFLANAVSLFVTLGWPVRYLPRPEPFCLLALPNSSATRTPPEWLSVLDSVGGGLMSSLSGMGVAFYTSLVGVACSIVLTLLRSIFSPQAERETLEARLELWLDHTVAPTLPTERAKDESEMVQQMVHAMDSASKTMGARAPERDRRSQDRNRLQPCAHSGLQQDRRQLQRRRARLLRIQLQPARHGRASRRHGARPRSGLREVSRILEKGGKQ